MQGQKARYWWVLGALGGLIVLIELVLTGADLRLWGGPDWRGWSYLYLSFQPRLLESTNPLWTGQWLAMFVTHSFVHIGLLHMAGNMLVFAMLAHLMRDERSLSEVLIICLISALSGALLFAYLAPPLSAMTGASGALSGLSAAWAIGSVPGQSRNSSGQTLILLAGIVLLLVLIEGLVGGGTAWQSHVGGALAGALFAVLRPSRKI